MCTVSYIPQSENGFIITSSRDEKSPRNARRLQEESVSNFKIVFPVDPLSNGTWIGSSEFGRTCCLLNGGKKKHVKKTSYRKSRGLVLVDFLSSHSLEDEIHNYDLSGIEPFTMIIIDHHDEKKYIELVWDENEKNISFFDRNIPKIWSSVTLYSTDVIKQKSEMFEEFLKEASRPESIADFHFLPQNILPVTDKPDSDHPITVSITQISGNPFETNIKHHDIINKVVQEDYLTLLRPFYA